MFKDREHFNNLFLALYNEIISPPPEGEDKAFQMKPLSGLQLQIGANHKILKFPHVSMNLRFKTELSVSSTNKKGISKIVNQYFMQLALHKMIM